MGLTQEEIDALPTELKMPVDPPVKQGETMISEVRLREPFAGELEAIDPLDDFKAAIELMAVCSGLLPDTIRKLPARRFKQGQAFLRSFTQDAQPTKSSGDTL